MGTQSVHLFKPAGLRYLSRWQLRPQTPPTHSPGWGMVMGGGVRRAYSHAFKNVSLLHETMENVHSRREVWSFTCKCEALSGGGAAGMTELNIEEFYTLTRSLN